MKMVTYNERGKGDGSETSPGLSFYKVLIDLITRFVPNISAGGLKVGPAAAQHHLGIY